MRAALDVARATPRVSAVPCVMDDPTRRAINGPPAAEHKTQDSDRKSLTEKTDCQTVVCHAHKKLMSTAACRRGRDLCLKEREATG